MLNAGVQSRCGDSPVAEIALTGSNGTSLRMHVHEESWNRTMGDFGAACDLELTIQHHQKNTAETFREDGYACTGVVYYSREGDGVFGVSFGGMLGCIDDPSITLPWDHFSEGDHVDFCFRRVRGVKKAPRR